ncbi:mediator of RNA polymerase II transcription subunit 11-like isoform X1 [Myxocyprinus asiaticus]|uniref:mediator of RNA polymerase II transcription subunit 11-like isoform X1 n=1 Tax=Myxocyprinus asiaticus TaxID=70543 RepID=UPI002222E2F3|nr:mediator of RNA polymerase II transcription subunit 11-like isoform X1 [Myxocyprinus asiaticus]
MHKYNFIFCPDLLRRVHWVQYNTKIVRRLWKRHKSRTYGTIMLELSKEKSSASLLDRQLIQFQTSINRVESELSAQIRYLTQVATGQPHEGSTYSARKDCQMALNRAEYPRVKLGELGRTCEIMLDPQT